MAAYELYVQYVIEMHKTAIPHLFFTHSFLFIFGYSMKAFEHTSRMLSIMEVYVQSSHWSTFPLAALVSTNVKKGTY